MPDVQPNPSAANVPGAAPPSGGGAASPQGTPAAAPLSTPNKQEGERMAAKLWVSHQAIPMMTRALVALKATTDEGKAILTALRALSQHFGSGQDEELAPAA